MNVINYTTRIDSWSADNPWPDYQLAVPVAFKTIVETHGSLLSLDVHAIAYKTYVWNQSLCSNNQENELSYLYAWTYATFPSMFLETYKHKVVYMHEALGTSEIKPKEKKEIAAENNPLGLNISVMETDEEYKTRLGPAHTFSVDAMKANMSGNPDKELVSLYLRCGPQRDFRSFIRKSFINEDFTKKAQEICVVLYYRSQNKDKSRFILGSAYEELAIEDSILKFAPIWEKTLSDPSLEDLDQFVAPAESEEIVTLATAVEGKKVREKPDLHRGVMNGTNVTFVRLQAHLNLLQHVNENSMLAVLNNEELQKLPFFAESMLWSAEEIPTKWIVHISDGSGNKTLVKMTNPIMMRRFSRLKTRLKLENYRILGIRDENKSSHMLDCVY